MNGPDQEPDDKGSGWNDFKDYNNSKSGASPFTYNPGVMDVSKEDGSFPETDDVEAPEKM